jgi:hypothetical protein
VLSPNFDTAGIDTIIIGGRYKADDVADIRPTVLEMRRRGLKVVLVGVMPTYRHARARELLMAMRRGEDPDASPYMERQWRLDDAIRTSIADIPGVTFVSPMRHFCSRTSCRQMLGRDPVTWDRSHITAAASINLLKAALEPNRMTVN